MIGIELVNILKIYYYTQLYQVFHFKLVELQEVLKYLGFVLKPNGYSIKDWGWLITKIESRIQLWRYRWLSSGERLTLVKAILDYNIPLYWHLLDHIREGVLKKISRLYCNFIRNGKGDKVSFQLARWNLMPCPNMEVDGG